MPGTTNRGTCLSSSHEPAYDSDERPRSRSNSKEDRPARWICAALRISSSRTIWWTWAAVGTLFFPFRRKFDDSKYIYIYTLKNFISTNFIRYVMKRLIILREILFSRVRIFRKEAIQRRGRRGRLKIGFENYRSLRASLEIFLSASSVHHVPLSTHRHCPTIVRISPNRDRAIVKSLWPVHNHSRCEFVEKKKEKKEGKDFSFLFYFNF